MKFSSKVQKCGLSPMRKFHPYAVAAEAKGRKIYHLNIGQPDIETPKAYFEAVRHFDLPVLEYAPSPGMPVLIDAIRHYYDKLDMHFDAGDILITNGGSEALQIAFNCIPHIDKFLEDDSTKEEWKMVVETKKIMGDDDIQVAATCVRVPVLRCHGESINVEFEGPVTVEEARAALEAAPGITVMDDPANSLYPMPGLLAGTNGAFVGRLRKDPSVENGLAFWNVADQIRKGAALNAVQIAQLLLP